MRIIFIGTGEIGLPALLLAWLALASPPGRALIVVAARRLLLRELVPGRYPRHGWLACRLWFVERLAEVCHVDGLAGTPWAGRYARLCGDRVGRGAHWGRCPLSPVCSPWAPAPRWRARWM